MISAQQIQERRLDELLRRQLGPRILAAIADSRITDILVNDDGRVWFEAHGKGLYEAGFSMPASQVESLIGTAAAALGAVANAEHPIVEGELPIERIRFEGLLPPVARRPCLAMRKPAQVLYTLDDYVRDGIVSEAQAEIFRDATRRRQNIAIGGGTGSGKTTLAGALINEMVALSAPGERYVIAAAYQRQRRPDAPSARDHAASARPHHHRRGARRRGAGAAEGVGHRASGRGHHRALQFSPRRAYAAIESGAGGGRAAAAGTDRRND